MLGDDKIQELVLKEIYHSKSREESILKLLQRVTTDYQLKETVFFKVTQQDYSILSRNKGTWVTNSKEVEFSQTDLENLRNFATRYKDDDDPSKWVYEDPIKVTEGLAYLIAKQGTIYEYLLLVFRGQVHPKTITLPIKKIVYELALLDHVSKLKQDLWSKQQDLILLNKELEKAYSFLPKRFPRGRYEGELTPTVINKVIPFSFISIMDELYGPKIFASNPEVGDNYELYVLPITNAFVSIDFDFLLKVGHIFTSTQIEAEEAGNEFISLLFAKPNDYARGGYELHAISLSVAQEYSNLLAFSVLEVRAILYMFHEEYRDLLNQYNGSLITHTMQPQDEERLKEQAQMLLYQLREELTRLLYGLSQ